VVLAPLTQGNLSMNAQESIKDFLTTELLKDHRNIGFDDNLLIGGLVDSLGVMLLISWVEEQFSMDVPPEDVTIEHFRSIRAIAEYIESRATTVAAD
jgi:acyl carrier protein